MKGWVAFGGFFGITFVIATCGAACGPNGLKLGLPGVGKPDTITFHIPDSLGDREIKEGSKVVWENHDSAPRTVTSPEGLFDSGSIAPGLKYSRVFNDVGDFNYVIKESPELHGVLHVTPLPTATSLPVFPSGLPSVEPTLPAPVPFPTPTFS